MTPEEKHRLHQSHAPEALAAVERVLAAPGPAPVLLLAGEPGCGRTGLLEAAAFGTDRQGHPTLVLPLDLDGYEEGFDLSRFAEVQIVNRWELSDGEREALRERMSSILQFVPPTLTGATLVSLLLRTDDPVAVWKEIPATAAEGDARPALSGLLANLSREGHLVVHAVESAQLTDPLRRWLFDETRRNPHLVLALSCSPADPDDRVAPGAESLRLDLQPLPAGDLLDPLHELLHGLELETADRLQRFLDLAALCGPNVPAEALFHHLELTPEQREDLLDVIDEELVEAGDTRLFVDHQYAHTSFPGLLTYTFLSAALRHALLEPVLRPKRERMAGELLEFFNQSIPTHTRGMTLLRFNLASCLEDDQARQFFLRELRVWIGPGEVEDLTAEFIDGIAGGRTSARDLLTAARQTEGFWPPFRRLAFIEAARTRIEDLPPDERLELHNQRAEILRELQRAPEAVMEARTAQEEARQVHGPDHPATARSLNLLGILLNESGELGEARDLLEEALAIQSRAAEDANLGSILANLGMVYRGLGQREEARERLERALALHRQAFGDGHPAVAADLGNLATLERELGDPARALEYLRPTVEIARHLYGDGHPETARALTNVAGLLREVGDGASARQHVDAALQINRSALGEAHPQVIADLNNLAVLERETGQIAAAREHFQEALAISRQVLGEDHPLTAQLRRSAAEG
ncbi:MAG TPA: tetratricopeptide repeat protein [Thermoanaerobaculia bacterium]|nr:tetratricopeptide repeat protein [Thermoanaerobaculia bacterium]